MSAPNAGRQSPDPESQSDAQVGANPGHSGSAKVDDSKAKDEGKDQESQTASLESNPKHVLEDEANEKTSKD